MPETTKYGIQTECVTVEGGPESKPPRFCHSCIIYWAI